MNLRVLGVVIKQHTHTPKHLKKPIIIFLFNKTGVLVETLFPNAIKIAFFETVYKSYCPVQFGRPFFVRFVFLFCVCMQSVTNKGDYR